MMNKLSGSEYDVVVFGGGPIGLAYAGWLKKKRPQTTIAVLEASMSPGFKIGESTLSTTIRNLVALGFTYPMLRRLFHVKAGLGYWWTSADTDDLEYHLDIVGRDETFQFERRVFEIAFLELSRRKGIEVLQGAKVLIKKSDIDSDIKNIVYTHEGQEHSVKAKIICDATGPARIVSKHLGIKDIELDDFNTNSYWAYFRHKKDHKHPDFWEMPVTKHLCFEDGWLWFIDVDSWEGVSRETIHDVASHLLDIGSTDDTEYPTRQALFDKFGCNTEREVSIGFVVRQDTAPKEKMTAEEGFWYYVNKYPAIKETLSHYELVGHKYQDNSFHKRTNIAHCTEKVAGKGWLSVGESAYLVDAFFSTGMNYGVGAAYMGAKHTANALDDNTYTSEKAFDRYQQYIDYIFDSLYRDNCMYYRSFKHKETYERVMMMKLAFIAPDLPYKEGFTEEDTYVWNISHPLYQHSLAEVLRILRNAEAKDEPVEAFLPRLNAVVDELNEFLLKNQRYAHIKMGKYFSHYDNDLKRDDMRIRDMSSFEVTHCKACDTWHIFKQIPACPNCGAPASKKRGMEMHASGA